MVDWLGRRIGIFGYGRTGRALVEYLSPIAAELFVLVDKPEREISQDGQQRFELVTGDRVAACAGGLDSLVLSPGVPLSNPAVQLFSSALWMATMLLVVVDLTWFGFRLRREIRTRFPDDRGRGHVFYGITRATQLRRLRLPKPRVRPGAQV